MIERSLKICPKFDQHGGQVVVGAPGLGQQPSRLGQFDSLSQHLQCLLRPLIG